MSIIGPGGIKTEENTNIVKPGEIIEWTPADPTQPIIIEPGPITVQLTPEIRIPTREDAINIPGDDDERVFVVKANGEDVLRILQADAERKQRAATRPPIEGKINIPGAEEWPYAIKLSPRAPRPDLKFNPETFTYISANVKSRQPYRIVQLHPTVLLPPRTRPDDHISTRPW